MKDIAATLFWVLLVLGAIFVVGYYAFFQYGFFAPRYEQVRYDTFRKSQAFNDGMRRELDQLRRIWLSNPSADQKASIKALIEHEFSGFDRAGLPADLQLFMADVESFR